MPDPPDDAPTPLPPSTLDPAEVTQLLERWSAGEGAALDRLLPLIYGELRQLAGRYLRRERSDHTLQTTALVHEAYLRLADQQHVRWQNRSHFFAIAAQAMRRILVDHARRYEAGKRFHPHNRVALEHVAELGHEPTFDFLGLDAALDALARLDPQQARVVELRFFGGLTIEETAEVLGISPATVTRDWRMARVWLRREMERIGATP